MSCKELPYQIPSVNITTFGSTGTKTKRMDAVRNRRLFGVVNVGLNPLRVWLTKNGDGDPIWLAPMSAAGKYDGGSIEFNGYNGEVWTNDASGYIYHFDA
jgi:hypothetical protein